MELSTDEIKKLARLSRLALDEGATEALREDLSRIVGYVQLLDEVDVEGVTPMTHAVPMGQRRRPDLAADEVVGRRGVERSAGYDDGLVRLPRIVE